VAIVKRLPVAVALVAFTVTALANYANDVMKPWVGATKQELVAKWGYPQAANDLVRIDEETVVYTYRSFRVGFGGPMPCVVSFTLQKDVVVQWKYEGEHCPRHKRQ
jgi:hypothetical protein